MVTTSDVIIEVLDARDPLGSRCIEAEKFIRKSGSDKKIILLLNKIGKSIFVTFKDSGIKYKAQSKTFLRIDNN